MEILKSIISVSNFYVHRFDFVWPASGSILYAIIFIQQTSQVGGKYFCLKRACLDRARKLLNSFFAVLATTSKFCLSELF